MARVPQTSSLSFLRRRIDAWILARVPRSRGPVVVSRKRVYILPTRFGYAFALLVLALLLGAMNYGNSMGFALAFLLGGLVLVAMHHTHANLVNLQLRALGAAPVFAGDEARLSLQLENASASTRYALMLSWREQPDGAKSQTDLAAGSGATLALGMPVQHRGRWRAGALRLASEYPLGLFHAWTYAEFDVEALVYPQPAPAGRTLPAAHGHGGTELATQPGHDEFSGLRNYQRGDSAHAIHWKSLPKSLTPMVKQFADSRDQESWLDWDTLAPLDTEARLSQLTRWVLDLDGLQQRYGLRLPTLTLRPNHGAAHREQCLQALALYELPRELP